MNFDSFIDSDLFDLHLKVNLEYGGINPATTQSQPVKQVQGAASSAQPNNLALPGIILPFYFKWIVCLIIFWVNVVVYDYPLCWSAPGDGQRGGVHNALVVAPDASQSRPYVLSICFLLIIECWVWNYWLLELFGCFSDLLGNTIDQLLF